jgi:hypothetical protein
LFVNDLAIFTVGIYFYGAIQYFYVFVYVHNGGLVDLENLALSNSHLTDVILKPSQFHIPRSNKLLFSANKMIDSLDKTVINLIKSFINERIFRQYVFIMFIYRQLQNMQYDDKSIID